MIPNTANSTALFLFCTAAHRKNFSNNYYLKLPPSVIPVILLDNKDDKAMGGLGSMEEVMEKWK